MRKINFLRLSQYDKYHLMMAVAEYADEWCFDSWDTYAEDAGDLEEQFAMLMDWDLFVRRWKTGLLNCWNQGTITLSADAGTGCDMELCTKIIADDGYYRLIQYSNVCDPIEMGVCMDLGSALYNAVISLGVHIRNWKYQKSLEGWEKK